MPISYIADMERGRVRITVTAPVTVGEFTAALDRQLADGVWTCARVVDFGETAPPTLSRDMQLFIAHMRRLVERHGPRGPVAIVARSQPGVNAAHLYRQFSGRPDRQVDVFGSAAEADAWLDRI